MIKTHNITGLKYLCYTKKENFLEYSGSGKYWLRHLKTHGNLYNTELIFESDDKNKAKTFALSKSLEYDIINSKDWANLMLEGLDGGDTVSKKKVDNRWYY